MALHEWELVVPVEIIIDYNSYRGLIIRDGIDTRTGSAARAEYDEWKADWVARWSPIAQQWSIAPHHGDGPLQQLFRKRPQQLGLTDITVNKRQQKQEAQGGKKGKKARRGKAKKRTMRKENERSQAMARGMLDTPTAPDMVQQSLQSQQSLYMVSASSAELSQTPSLAATSGRLAGFRSIGAHGSMDARPFGADTASSASYTQHDRVQPQVEDFIGFSLHALALRTHSTSQDELTSFDIVNAGPLMHPERAAMLQAHSDKSPS